MYIRKYIQLTMPSFRHRIVAKIIPHLPECIGSTIVSYMLPSPSDACQFTCGIYDDTKLMFVTLIGELRVFHHDTCPDAPNQCMFCHAQKPQHVYECIYNDGCIICSTPEQCISHGFHLCSVPHRIVNARARRLLGVDTLHRESVTIDIIATSLTISIGSGLIVFAFANAGHIARENGHLLPTSVILPFTCGLIGYMIYYCMMR
jgi:hypothetical protein